ncbi:NAD(P)-dependent oxidoreductase [uncultured Clostridium sp.]|uniref:NAD-dependent epimerase/dehydratase family protein n=1 Tax=uncultured Clostridium sp. TaxID=59620 RepID=UPI0025F6F4B5|nr:NAD(P)-dependent oxidoreductase [uncultured Clostridium sp.]
MKVLIIGNCGILAKKLADRFYKEGYDVHIVDNIEKEIYKNYVYHNLDIEDIKFKDILLENNFEVIISVKEGIDNSLLIKMLENCNKVKNFIFVSSIYSEKSNKKELLTRTCIDYYRKELYLNISCLKVSEIYGEDDESTITKIINNNYDFINNSQNKYKNYIYVGDVVDAIYKTSQQNRKLDLNIVSDYMYSTEEIKKIFEDNILNKSKIKQVDLSSVGRKSTIENQKTKSELGWNIKFNIEEGLKKVYLSSNKNPIVNNLSKEKKEIKEIYEFFVSKLKIFRPYIENIFLLSLFYILNLGFGERFSGLDIDFNLLYILIVSIVYGTSQSIIAIILASALGVLLKIQGGTSIITLLYDPDTLVKFIIYLLVGTCFGYIIDSKNSEIKSWKKELQSVTEKFQFTNEKCKNLRKEKKLLEEQIVSSNDSLGKLYWIIEKLNSLNPELIFEEAVSVISNVMKSKEVCIYIFSKDKVYLRLISKTSDLDENIIKSINLEEYLNIRSSLLNKEVFLNRKMIKNIPDMLCPIIIEGNIIGVVGINNLLFEEFTLYKHNLFKVVVDILTKSLAVAYKYEQAILDEKYVRGTEILRSEYFKELTKSRYLNNQENNVVLKVSKENYKNIKHYIRTSDYLGVNERDELLILLVNTKREEADIVIKRLLEKHVESEIVDFKYVLDI